MTIKTAVKRQFSRAANTYDSYSHVQQLVGEALIQRLQQKKEYFPTILDLGAGTGLTSQRLFNALKPTQLTLIDFSSNMLTLAKQKFTDTAVTFEAQDFDKLSHPDQPIDLLFSNMSLQWSENLASIFNKSYTMLERNGLFAISLPIKGSFVSLKKNKNLLKLPNKKSLISQLKSAGFKKVTAQTEMIIQSFDTFERLLHSLKKTGVTAPTSDKTQGLYTQKHLKQLEENTRSPFTLTFNILYIIASK